MLLARQNAASFVTPSGDFVIMGGYSNRAGYIDEVEIKYASKATRLITIQFLHSKFCRASFFDGIIKGYESKSKSYFIYVDQGLWERKIEWTLPDGMFDHCAQAINDTHFIVTGDRKFIKSYFSDFIITGDTKFIKITLFF